MLKRIRETTACILLFLFSLFLGVVWQVILGLRLYQGKEKAERVKEKWGKPSLKRPFGKIIWINGASIGESRSALGVIDRLLNEDPSLSILLTTVTKDAASLMSTVLPERAFHQMLPVDCPHIAKRFLNYWKPEAVFFIESDFWPFLLREVRLQKIPVFLLNGRISLRSFRLWKYLPFIIRPLLRGFQVCFTPSEEQAERLKLLGAGDVRITGNLKFTVPPLHVHKVLLEELTSACTGRNLWLVSNTHPGEEEIVLDTHRKLLKDFPDLLLFLCPRHIQRAAELELLLKKHSFVYLRFFKWLQDPKPLEGVQVLLGDTLGNIGIFYALHSLVVMGGSLLPDIGGHNLIEPAQLNCCLLFGPYMENNLEIAETFETKEAAVKVQLADELYQKMLFFLNHPEAQLVYQQRAKNLVASSEKILDDILNALHV